jgi:AGZA family xanthine/uracil permease-like MFS transporter
VLGILPHLCHWAGELVRNTLGAVGAGEVTPAIMAKLGQAGVALEAFDLVGGGAVLTGIVLAAVAVYVIERRFLAAAAFCIVGAAFSAVGLMHSSKLQLAASPWMSVGYLVLGAAMIGARLMKPVARTTPGPETEPVLEAL